VIAGNTSRYGYASVITGIEEGARAAGYLVLIAVVDSMAPVDVARVVDLVLAQQVAGAVVLKFDQPGVVALRAVGNRVPTVAVGGVQERRIPQVLVDEAGAAAQATRYLLQLGHRTVHHLAISGPQRGSGRILGWRRALTTAGASVPAPVQCGWEPASAFGVGRRLATDASITAVLCGNDDLAVGLLSGLSRVGRRVPEDISVVGFDDIPLAEFTSPSLTTVRQDFAGLGRDAFELLQARIDDRPGARVRRSVPELIIRRSAAPPPI
jgi:DNA-binding LacI/PurR family transcriptional regulator